MKPYYLSIGVYILLCILTYYWLYNVINFDFITNETFADATSSNSYFDSMTIGKPYYIIDSTNYLCLTVSDDNKSVSMKPYPNDTDLKQLWVPVKDGNINIRSQPDNRSCNKTTQSKINYQPNEMLLKNYSLSDFYLHFIYNKDLNEIEYNIIRKITTKVDRKLVNNLDSPIFTGILADRNQCTSWNPNQNCLTCTKCHQTLTECSKTGGDWVLRRHHNPSVTFYEHAYNGASWTFGIGNYPVVQWYGVWNDAVSSFSIGPGTRVYVYEHWWYGGASLGYDGPRNVLFQETIRTCFGRGGCFNQTRWSWWNDRMSSFIIQDSPGNTWWEWVPKCVEYRKYCAKCQVFTGKYNPITCMDETNNLPSIRRYKFEQNKLKVVNNINIENDAAFSSGTQSVTVNSAKNPTVTISNPINFYFVPREHRNRFYQQYLIRNNLLPRNVDLQNAITEDVENNTLPK